MKKFLITILVFSMMAAICLFLSACRDDDNKGEKNVFYIDSTLGSNKNDGKTEKSAWKTLDALKNKTFAAGDTICLKGEFEGPLKFEGSGEKNNPITVKSYGGKKAIINGLGVSSAVILNTQSNIIISDLEITNKAIVDSGTIRRSGITVLAEEGIVSNVTIRGCDVHDVDGIVLNPQMFYNAGIYIKHLKRGDEQNHFNGVSVENCTLTDIKGVGIRVADGYDWPEGYDAMNLPPLALTYEFKNIVIRGTEINRTGADGIILANCYKPLVEDVKCFDAGYWSNASTSNIAGVWSCSTDSATFRRVEVARTRFINGDGQAFDTDWGSKGTFTWEYCYTHDNDGGVILRHVAADGVFRYCVSVNDENPLKTFPDGSLAGTKGLIYFASVDNAYNKGKMHFYNCVFYQDKTDMAIAMGAAFDPIKNNWLASQVYDNSVNEFSNCIFVSRNAVDWGKNQKYSNNCYYMLGGTQQAPEQDTSPITANPLFVGVVEKDENGFVKDKSDPSKYFSLQANSPLIAVGRIIENNGGMDYLGRLLSNTNVCIGAFEYE